MVRWQYVIVNIGTINTAVRLGQTLSYFGERGWELVSIYDKASNWMADTEKGFVLLKREVPDGHEPDGPWTELYTTDEVLNRYLASRP